MNTIRILADDLTGALDTAAAFSGEVPVFLDSPPSRDSQYWNAPVSVVATPTRDVPIDTLPAHLEPVLDWFQSGSLAYKKVDSLLRGNTFAEIAWLLRHGEFTGAIFAPAFPAQGRITFGNRQWVASPGKERVQVAQPLREAFVEFQMTTGTTPESLGKGQYIWIPEVLDDADLDQLALLSAKKSLRCGSAGLAHAIARQQGLAPSADAKSSPLSRKAGPTLLISASYQPVMYEQWDTLKAAVTPSAIAEQARPDEIARAIEIINGGAGQAWFDLSHRREMLQEEAAVLLQQNVEQLVDGLTKPGQLLVVGGDTLLRICRATGANALLAGASVRTGWGCARLTGGRWDGIPCYSRSGAFGAADDLLTMIRLLEG